MSRSKLVYREALTDYKFNQLTLAEQGVFVRLLLVADDNGIFPADRRDLYRLGVVPWPKTQGGLLSTCLDKLATLGITVGYMVEVHGEGGKVIGEQKFFYFKNWRKYQRFRQDIKKDIHYPEPPLRNEPVPEPVTNPYTLHPHPHPHSLTHPPNGGWDSQILEKIKADISSHNPEDVKDVLKTLRSKLDRGEKFADPAGWVVSELRKRTHGFPEDLILEQITKCKCSEAYRRGYWPPPGKTERSAAIESLSKKLAEGKKV
ncbi:MAG: hypothetical protein Q6354_03905 [Candidatus Brocadiales bacterium]|nr:hypothetical protein [Candidatus Brocadiales bacterium]